MTPEEKKARKSEYMKKYYRNMNDYQREKIRLKNLENKKHHFLMILVIFDVMFLFCQKSPFKRGFWFLR